MLSRLAGFRPINGTQDSEWRICDMRYEMWDVNLVDSIDTGEWSPNFGGNWVSILLL